MTSLPLMRTGGVVDVVEAPTAPASAADPARPPVGIPACATASTPLRPLLIIRAVDVATVGAVLAATRLLIGGPLLRSAVAHAVLVAGVAVLGASLRYPVSVLDRLPALLRSLSWTALPFVPFLVGASDATALAWQVCAAPFAVTAGRAASMAFIRHRWRRGVDREPIVVVGSGVVACRLASTLSEHPEYGLDVCGYVDDRDDPDMPVPRLGATGELDGVLYATDARRVVVAFSSTSEDRFVEGLRRIASRRVEVLVVPRLFDIAAEPGAGASDHIWGIPVERLSARAAPNAGWTAKRTFDAVVAGALLVLLAPALGAIALAVRLSSPGPILFRQVRIGQHGQRFELLKYRSMRPNLESDHQWTVGGDDRVTRIGRIIRRYSLDELPQLWNVLRGDMSLVGPRPERPTFVTLFNAQYQGYDARHRAPVGLTGWAQVNGLRGDTSIEERARFDNAYVERWSMWRDVVILLRTAAAVFRGEGL